MNPTNDFEGSYIEIPQNNENEFDGISEVKIHILNYLI